MPKHTVFRSIRKTFSASHGSSNQVINGSSNADKTMPVKGDNSHKTDRQFCTSHSTASLSDVDADWIVRKTETKVAEAVDKSSFIKENCTLYKLPKFSHEDFELDDEVLATGGFCQVRAINKFLVPSDCLDRNSVEPRKYVIKHLAPKLVDKPKQLAIGANDLVMEGFIMSSLHHENILEVKGFASSGVSGYATTGRIDGFFLILPRLDKTLYKQLHEWRAALKHLRRKDEAKLARSSGSSSLSSITEATASESEETQDIAGCSNGSKVDTKPFPFCVERIQTAVEIASAIGYCHEKRILYRDLKPANIGYSFEEDRIKLFDFGLAVELPPSNDPEATFKLPGNTGTARYMSPEVINTVPYGLKADVFSFSMLLYEIMALSKPFDKLTGKEVKEEVAVLGHRPSIDKSWPLPIRRLLRRGFSETPELRPTMEEVEDILEDLVESFH